MRSLEVIADRHKYEKEIMEMEKLFFNLNVDFFSKLELFQVLCNISLSYFNKNIHAGNWERDDVGKIINKNYNWMQFELHEITLLQILESL